MVTLIKGKALLIFLSFSIIGYSQSLQKIQEIDEYISTPRSMNYNSYFDSLLINYPMSDYIIGLKTIFLIYNNDLEEAGLFLMSKINNKDFEAGTYAYMAKGLLKSYQQNDSMALGNYNKSMRLDKNRTNKWLYLELYYFYKDIDKAKAINFLNEALKIDNNFYDAKLASACTYDLKNKCRQIINIFNQFSIEWLNVEDLILGAFAYYYCNEITEAKQLFHEAIKIEPTEMAYIGLGNIERILNQNYILAENFYRKSLEIDTTYEGLVGIGWCSFYQENFNLAEKYLLQSLSLLKNQSSYNELILFYLRIGKYREAQFYNDKTISEFGTNYYNEGFEIILDIFKNGNKGGTSLARFINMYNNEAEEWLMRLIQLLR